MSSPVVAWMTAVAGLWEGLTPPTRAHITYHEVEGKRRSEGTAGDRGFVWSLPSRLEPVAEFGSASTHVDWRVTATLRLSQAAYSLREFADAVANESNLFMRAVETTSSWPAGVIEVISEATEAERDGDRGDALVVFNFRILCSETD